MTDPAWHEKGRAVYNFRCYFCHGYSGDAKTVAAQQLAPPPRDFTNSPDLTAERIRKALDQGIPGTAMKSFKAVIPDDERAAVADFVAEEFVRRRSPNTAYHTVENGWPDHEKRYGVAYPFVRHQLSLDTPVGELSATQRQGRDLYIDSCITCHEPKEGRADWQAYPLSHMGQVIREPVDAVSRPSVYAIHDRSPDIKGLTAVEQQGRDLFEANCAFCHAKDGTGKNWIGAFLEPHPRNLTDAGQVRHITPQRLEKVIREGLEGTSMPAWGAVLDDAQVRAVVAYVERVFLAPAREGKSATDAPKR